MRAALAIAWVCAGLGSTAWAQSGPSPHQVELERHRDYPVLPALIGDGGTPTVPLLPRARPAREARMVFGYLPYWIGPGYFENLDWGLLTHIAPFSVEVNVDGTIANDHGWPWTALVDSAHTHGVRVIPTATLFGDSQVLQLIADDEHRRTFFWEIRQRLVDGRADGLNVDFEGPSANGWAALINDFMGELTEYLHTEIPGCEVSFAAPAVDWGGRWDQVGLANSCDYLFIMGYAWSGSWSDVSGPTAPLTGGWRNLTTTVTGSSDYGDVTRNSPEKLILGMPYYGCDFETAGADPGDAVRDFVKYPQLRETLPGAQTYGRQWHVASSTSWYRYKVGERWRQVWYDDPTSLGLKIDLALKHNLGGVGMWALGYEGDRREPWEVLALKLGYRTPGTAVEEEVAVQPGQLSLGQNYPNPFNGSTHIGYSLPAGGTVTIQVLDLLGQTVVQWQKDHAFPGRYTWTWDGRSATGEPAASGLYLYRLTHRDDAGQELTITRRLVLAR